MSKENLKISIIIPVLNEETHIGGLVSYIRENSSAENILEILVVDGESEDNTVAMAHSVGAKVLFSKKGRAKQMNFGAKFAGGDILYFLHADTFPPKHFDKYIIDTVTKHQAAGCFQMKFDSNNLLLSIFAWFSKYNNKLCRGGDQSLFITQKLFKETNGFNEDYVVFEDNEFIGRLYQFTNFTIVPHYVKTSARKYRKKGIVKLQYHFGVIHLKNYLGAGPEKLYDYYKRKISA